MITHALVDGLFHRLVYGRADVLGQIHRAVGNNLDFLLFAVLIHGDVRDRHTGIFQFTRTLTRDDLARLGEHFAGGLVDNRAAQRATGQPVGQAQFLIVFIATDAGQVVPAGVEEQVIQMLL